MNILLNQTYMHSVRTNISVIDITLFKLFFEANEMKTVQVGTYESRVNKHQVNNYICYAYSDKDTIAVANMTYMSLKYGSVENAFKEYIKEIRCGIIGLY